MPVPDNPYASVLEGLTIADPIAAFFGFCRERERVRMRRAAGEPPPWSDDPIFQNGRFLNVFREDDRGTKAVFRFAETARADLTDLVQALFFARWCNHQPTLDRLRTGQLRDADRLAAALTSEIPQPWANLTAYPVEPVLWRGVWHGRLESCTVVFEEARGFLVQALGSSGGDAVRATAAVNAEFKMANDFPIFMAVVDLAGFRPDVIDPASRVPTGIGAVAFLDRLQTFLKLADHHQTCARMVELQRERWPEARRPFQPIDIEFLSCECRKYYSYVNGTKRFEGKNLFRPTTENSG